MEDTAHRGIETCMGSEYAPQVFAVDVFDGCLVEDLQTTMLCESNGVRVSPAQCDTNVVDAITGEVGWQFEGQRIWVGDEVANSSHHDEHITAELLKDEVGNRLIYWIGQCGSLSNLAFRPGAGVFLL